MAYSFEPVRDRIRSLLVESGVPSVAVAVARGGEILWEEGFGWANREDRIPATEHTMYSLASISKPITTTGLMTLVEAGKIDLDHPIDDYLGAAKLTARVGDARDATVRRVADHTAGLPIHYQFFFADEAHRRPDMDETIRRYATVFSPPGEQNRYSNLGYGLLDHVIARVSGESFADYMRRAVFLPLGLTHTSIDIAPGLEAYEAVRYDPDGLAIPFYDFDHPGASAVYASAHDLVRFGMFHLKDHLPDQRAILRDETLDVMHGPAGEPGYFIGWRSHEVNGHRIVTHNGGMPGVATSLELFPDDDVALVVLCNAADRGPLTEIRDAILGVVLSGWAAEPGPEPVADAGPVDMSPIAGTWEGIVATYVADLPIRIEVRPDGDVHVRLGDQLTTLLNGARFDERWLTGVTTGDLGTPDVNRRDSYRLEFGLELREGRLRGVVAATNDGKRMFRVGHWADLSRLP